MPETVKLELSAQAGEWLQQLADKQIELFDATLELAPGTYWYAVRDGLRLAIPEPPKPRMQVVDRDSMKHGATYDYFGRDATALHGRVAFRTAPMASYIVLMLERWPILHEARRLGGWTFLPESGHAYLNATRREVNFPARDQGAKPLVAWSTREHYESLRAALRKLAESLPKDFDLVTGGPPSPAASED